MIYFISAREIGRVKIGFSETPRSRFVKMRTDSPVPLELERICDGDTERERELHTLFADERVSGEWFNLSPRLEAYMETLAAPEAKQRRKEALGTELARVVGIGRPYASQLANGNRPVPMRIALAFYNATQKRIGALVTAEPHEIATLNKFIGPWDPAQPKRKA